jgi:hypothetical protein
LWRIGTFTLGIWRLVLVGSQTQWWEPCKTRWFLHYGELAFSIFLCSPPDPSCRFFKHYRELGDFSSWFLDLVPGESGLQVFTLWSTSAYNPSSFPHSSRELDCRFYIMENFVF